MTKKHYPSERRMHPRTRVNMSIQVMRMDPDAGDLIDQVEMVDISRGGIGLVSDKSFYPGQRLVMKLPATGMDVRSICGVIRRCERRGESFQVGVEFDHPIASLCADGAKPVMAAAAA